MSIRISAAAAIAGLDAQLALINVGAAASTVVVYNGVRPPNIATAIGAQPVLATFDVPDPAFPASVQVGNEVKATASAIDPVNAEAAAVAPNNVATFFRAFDGNGLAILDGDVTDTSGNGDMRMANTALLAGLEVKIVSWVMSVPLQTP